MTKRLTEMEPELTELRRFKARAQLRDEFSRIGLSPNVADAYLQTHQADTVSMPDVARWLKEMGVVDMVRRSRSG